MAVYNIVIDTNVIISALRSKLGASYMLLMQIGTGRFIMNLSVPLVMEYEKVLADPKQSLSYTPAEVSEILDYLCAQSAHHEIHFLWRPFLRDPKDDMVLELAVSASANYIVTFNVRDFRRVDSLGIEILTPKDLLKKMGEIS